MIDPIAALVAELGATPKIDAAGRVSHEELVGWRDRIARSVRFARESPPPPTAAERETLRVGALSFDELLQRAARRPDPKQAEPAATTTDVDALLRRAAGRVPSQA